MFAIRLVRAIALGNGDRRQNDQLATFQGCEAADLFAAAAETTGCDLKALPGTVILEDGVTPIEVVTALRNAQLCTIVDVDHEPQSASVDNTDAPKPAQPPAKPVKPGKKK